MLAHMLSPMPLFIHDALHAHHRLSLVEPRVTETEHAFAIEADVPGVAPSDIKIEFDSESNSVRIHGSTGVAAHTHFVDFTTAFGSHVIVDADNAKATVEHGVISITLPKSPESEAEVPTHVRIPVSGEADEEPSSAAAAYRLTVTAPGFAASEITVEAQANAQPHRKQQDGMLKISGESKRIKEARKRLEEVFRLPRDADTAGATASQVDGILTIRIPKRLAPAARRIPISLKAVGGRRKLPETAEQAASSSSAASKSDEADEPVMV